MGRFQRSISFAYDKNSGEKLDLDEVFKQQKTSFKIREEFAENNIEWNCCECHQKLNISTSKNDRMHLKHLPKSDDCILKEGNLSIEDIEVFKKIHFAKESPRHKELKTKIGLKLKLERGVDHDSIAIDNKFIIKNNEKRKPDVYCRYYDKELVFEIQLSELSLKYIKSRSRFYSRHGIYLIWILDNCDPRNPAQKDRDIKYITDYQNYFKLDENAIGFKLICDYKISYLDSRFDSKYEVRSKWMRSSVLLNEMSFNDETHQMYYYDFGGNVAENEKKSRQLILESQATKEKRTEELALSNAEIKAKRIIAEIGRLKRTKINPYYKIESEIEGLNNFELRILNSSLKLTNNDKLREAPILKWIIQAEEKDSTFLNFIINCTRIELDVNVMGAGGETPFQEIHKNSRLTVKHYILKGLFRRGYLLTTGDKEFILAEFYVSSEMKDDAVMFELFNRLSNRGLVDQVERNFRLLLIIESIRRNEVIGFNYTTQKWLQLANNGINNYGDYWHYIEYAFKVNEIWDVLIQSDSKGTISKRLKGIQRSHANALTEVDQVIADLYPDIFYCI